MKNLQKDIDFVLVNDKPFASPKTGPFGLVRDYFISKFGPNTTVEPCDNICRQLNKDRGKQILRQLQRVSILLLLTFNLSGQTWQAYKLQRIDSSQIETVVGKDCPVWVSISKDSVHIMWPDGIEMGFKYVKKIQKIHTERHIIETDYIGYDDYVFLWYDVRLGQYTHVTYTYPNNKSTYLKIFLKPKP